MLYHRLTAITVAALTASLLFAACASPKAAKRGGNRTFSATDPANGKLPMFAKPDAIPSPVTGDVKISTPYEVNGVTYYPLARSEGYSETGVASWYGPNFHGKLSANGETYDMNDRTCAHLILPFNVMVKVENLENGKSTVVRVNDRGPFAKDRIIDLSRKAAEELDVVKNGTAKVRLTVVDGGPSLSASSGTGGRQYSGKTLRKGGTLPKVGAMSPSGSSGSGYYIQAGSYSRPENANEIKGKIPSKYKGLTSVKERETSIGVLHRVVIGPFANRFEASKAARMIKIYARTGAIITSEP